MRRMSRVICIAVAFVLTMGMVRYHVAKADAAEGEETKIYSNATLEGEFADNRVLVVLNNEASISVDQLDVFADCVNCSEVRSLSEATETKVQNRLNEITVELQAVAEKTRTSEIVTTENVIAIAAKDEMISRYNQILCFDLKETGKDKVLEAIAALEKMDEVLYAGPDYIMTLGSTTANDPHADQQWALNMIDLPQAWDITTGSASVTVAVIDSGIDGDHPDLEDHIDVNLSRVYANGSEENVEYVIDTYIKDGAKGHGTAVAGIIGAVGDNGVGITGTCWNVKLVSLRVYDQYGLGTSSWVIDAIDFAESQDIPIINFSGSWYGDAHESNCAMNAAISNYSGLFVSIAGNEGVNVDTNVSCPAHCTASNMIIVGACSEDDEVWSASKATSSGWKYWGSNFGKSNVDIFAPGENIYSTNSEGGYEASSGTSFAAPFVAGVAALLLSADPTLTVSELKTAILTGGEWVYDSEGDNVYYDYCSSGKRLNANNALEVAAQ